MKEMSDFQLNLNDSDLERSILDGDDSNTFSAEVEMDPNDAVLEQMETNEEPKEKKSVVSYNQLRKRASELGCKFQGTPTRKELEEAIMDAETTSTEPDVSTETVVSDETETTTATVDDPAASEQANDISEMSGKLNEFAFYLKNDPTVQKYVGKRRSISKSVTAVLRGFELLEQAFDKVNEPESTVKDKKTQENKPFIYPDQAEELLAALPESGDFVPRSELTLGWCKDDDVYWSVVEYLSERNQLVRGRGRGGRIARHAVSVAAAA